MVDKNKALRMALEALESLQGGCTDSDDGTVEAITVWCPEVIDAIREALAQPEQEPHGWYIDGYGAVIGTEEPKSVRVGEWLPWYITSPQRKPLTDEQCINQMLSSGFERNFLGWSFTYGRLDYHLLKFARAIETAHGIKE